MQFFKPEYFMLLWVLPLIAAVFLASKKIWESRIRKFGDPETVCGKLIPDFSKGQWLKRSLFLMLAFFFAVLALARPQWGEEKKRIQRKGADIIFMLDTSLSMLAEDIKPDRLRKSKIEIESFLRGLKGDRVGMVAFAGSSFLQVPLTLDYAAFQLFLDAIDTGYIPDPGTSLEAAIRRVVVSFPEDQPKHRAVILFSDGEDHEGGVDEAIEIARNAGVRIYAVGMGTKEGEPIPLKDESGNKTGYKKDASGQVVVTRLNEENLEKIAKETGGIYLPTTPGEREVDLILKHLGSLGETTFKERLIAEKEDHFQLFVSLSFFFLVLDLFVRRKNRRAAKTLMVLLLFTLNTGFLQSPSALNEEGNKLFSEKKYQSAAGKYQEAKVKAPDDPVVLYNLGSALYELKQYQDARHNFESAVEKAQDPELKAKALYNYGNSLYRLGEFDKAIQAYKDALTLNPEDEDSKYNLEFLQKSKNRFEKKDQDRQKESQQQNQQQQQQQQQQQNQQQQQQPQQKQDQQKQDQQQPQQNEGKDQKEEPQEGQEEGEQKSDTQDQQDNKQGQSGEDRQDESDKQPDQGEQQQPKDPGQEGEEKPAAPEEKPGEQQQNQQQEQERPAGGQEQQQAAAGAQGKAPMQGQMNQDQALRILDALRESEKDLQDLRRPPQQRQDSVVLKDW